MKKENGIALISVLWAMMFLTIIALAILSISKKNSILSSNILKYTKAEFEAEGGLNYALHLLSARDAVRKISLGIYSTQVEVGGRSVKIEIIPEEGKIDINNADSIMISGLLAYYKFDEIKAAEIADKIKILKNQSSGVTFATLSDLLNVEGFPKDIFTCIKPYLTAYSQRIGIDRSVTSSQMNDYIKWADNKRWGGKTWLNISGSSVGGLVSGKSVLRQQRTYSGRAFTIKTAAQIGGNINVQKEAIIRITGSLSKPYWVYSWKTIYNDSIDCKYLSR